MFVGAMQLVDRLHYTFVHSTVCATRQRHTLAVKLPLVLLHTLHYSAPSATHWLNLPGHVHSLSSISAVEVGALFGRAQYLFGTRSVFVHCGRRLSQLSEKMALSGHPVTDAMRNASLVAHTYPDRLDTYRQRGATTTSVCAVSTRRL